jgi:hypothetical protein
MRTFLLGLTMAAMAAAVWASDEADTSDTKVGDWVKTKTTTIEAGMPALKATLLMQIKVIEDGMITRILKTTLWSPGSAPHITTQEVKLPFTQPKPTDSLRIQAVDRDGTKVEVLEEGERTVEVNGATFEDVFYQKVKMTREAEDDKPEFGHVIEIWVDDKAPFLEARTLKTVITGMKTSPQGEWVEYVATMERMACGRADDPTPEDE